MQHHPALPWLGVIPADWEVERGRFIFIQEARRPGELDGVVTAFRDGQVTLRENRRTGGFTLAIKETDYQGVRRGDLVIHSMDAFAGAIGVSESDGKCTGEYAVCNPHFEGFNNRYFAHVLREMALQGFIYVICPSVRERAPRFRFARLKDVHLPVPSLSSQKAIADFLDHKTAAIDALIEKKQKLLDLLAEKRAALINQAVTKGLDPNVPMKDSGIPWIGEIPAHWEVMQLRRTLRGIEQGWSPQCDARPVTADEWGVLKAGCTAAGVFRPYEHKALPPELEPRPHLQVRQGDLLMSRASGSPDIVGSAALVGPLQHRLLLSDKLFRLQVDGAVAVPDFLVMALGNRSARSQIENSISGAEGLANNLPQARLKEVIVACAPVREQQDIASTVAESLEGSRRLAGSLSTSVERLQEYRQALITAAVTGQLDIIGEAAV